MATGKTITMSLEQFEEAKRDWYRVGRQKEVIEANHLHPYEECGLLEVIVETIDTRFFELRGFPDRDRLVFEDDPAAVALPRLLVLGDVVPNPPGSIDTRGDRRFRSITAEAAADRGTVNEFFAVKGYLAVRKAEGAAEESKAATDKILAESRREMERLQTRIAAEQDACREANDRLAVAEALRETGKPGNNLPDKCPWDLDTLLESQT